MVFFFDMDNPLTRSKIIHGYPVHGELRPLVSRKTEHMASRCADPGGPIDEAATRDGASVARGVVEGIIHMG